MVEFLLSIIILGVTALLSVSLFNLSRIFERLLVWSLVAFANLVIVFQVANLFGKLNEVSFILIVQLAFLVVVFGVWLFQQRPRLFPEVKANIDWITLIKEKQPNYRSRINH